VVPASAGQPAELFAPAVTVSVYVPSAGVQLLFEPPLLDPLLDVLEPLLEVLEPLELDVLEPLLEVLEPLELDEVLEPLLELLPLFDEDEHATDPVPSMTVPQRRVAPRPTR
jgi:hypothetical protein